MMDGIESYQGRLNGYEITGYREWTNGSEDEHHGEELIEEVGDEDAEFFSLHFLGLKSEKSLFVKNFKTREKANSFALKMIRFSWLWVGEKQISEITSKSIKFNTYEKLDN